MKCECCKNEVGAELKFCPACGAAIKKQELPDNVTSTSRQNALLATKIEERFSALNAVKNIFVGKGIPADALSRYKELSEEEEPLVLVNSGPALLLFGYTGVLITKTRLHYIAQKKGFRGTFFGSGEKLSGSASLKNHHFFIGDDACCSDGSYLGDEFYIDGKLRGWIRFDKMPWIRGWSPSRKGVNAMRELFSVINKINE